MSDTKKTGLEVLSSIVDLSGIVNSIIGFVGDLFGPADWQVKYNQLEASGTSLSNKFYFFLNEAQSHPFGDWALNQFHEFYGNKAEQQGHGWRNRLNEMDYSAMIDNNSIVSNHLDGVEWRPLLIDVSKYYTLNNGVATPKTGTTGKGTILIAQEPGNGDNGGNGGSGNPTPLKESFSITTVLLIVIGFFLLMKSKILS